MLPIHKPYIIGETAFHHEGDIAFLKELIRNAQNNGVDAIKFHLLIDLDDYMIGTHEALEILRPWCLNAVQWDEVLAACGELDIVLLCNDVKSVEFALSKGESIKAIEIHATGINDVFLLEAASKFPNTVILGSGGSTLDEIDFAIQYLRKQGKQDVFLMHGFQSYPTDFKDIKLDRMNKLKNLFGLPVGYADHTDPADPNNAFISCLGIANGHNVIEKHFTHAFGEKRIDAQSAVSLEQLQNIRKLAQITWESVGASNSLELSEAELKYGNTGPMKKAIVARETIQEDELITLDKIAFKRTNESSSLKQLELSKLLNNKAKTVIQKDEIIDLSNVEYQFVLPEISQFKNTKS